MFANLYLEQVWEDDIHGVQVNSGFGVFSPRLAAIQSAGLQSEEPEEPQDRPEESEAGAPTLGIELAGLVDLESQSISNALKDMSCSVPF